MSTKQLLDGEADLISGILQAYKLKRRRVACPAFPPQEVA